MKYLKQFLSLILILIPVISQAQNDIETTLVKRAFAMPPRYDLYITIDYADQVKVTYNDSDSVMITANVYLVDESGKSKNKDFRIDLSRETSVQKVNIEIANIKAHYVFQKSGSDFDPKTSKLYKAEKALLVGTTLEISIPRNVNLELSSDMGEIEIDHNSADLLVSNNGSITLNISPELKADLDLSSSFGEVNVAKGIKLEKVVQKDESTEFQKISGQGSSKFRLNGGGVAIALKTLGGDITIKQK